MPIHQSDHAKGTKDSPYPAAAGVATTYRSSMSVPLTAVANDILELGPIPAGCRLADIVLDCDDLDADGAPAIVFNVGVMSGDAGDPDPSRTCGSEFFTASDLGQSGGVARPALVSAYRDAPASAARSIGIEITTIAATPQAGSIGVTLTVVAV